MENRSKTWDMANFAFLKFHGLIIFSLNLGCIFTAKKPEKENAINVVLENIAFQKLSLKICSCYIVFDLCVHRFESIE